VKSATFSGDLGIDFTPSVLRSFSHERKKHLPNNYVTKSDQIDQMLAVLRVADRIRFAIPQPTEWQRIGNQIDAAGIFTGSHFISVMRQLRGNAGWFYRVAAD
jgi:hypothetical protein